MKSVPPTTEDNRQDQPGDATPISRRTKETTPVSVLAHFPPLTVHLEAQSGADSKDGGVFRFSAVCIQHIPAGVHDVLKVGL